jgi:phospholipid/cholesterol/gamma-HCH transport system substrate-binding protein
MPEKKHNFTGTEVLAGLLVVASVVTLVGFVVVIQGRRPKEEMKSYHARFANTIGLAPAANVRFGGVVVGKVTDIRPDDADQSLIRVDAEIRADVPVNAKSLGTIEQLSLTAERHLEISTGEPDAELLPPGSEVETLTKSASFVDMPDVDGVIKRVETLLDDVIDVLGVDEAKEKEEKGLEEFTKLTAIVNQVKGALDEGTGAIKDVRATLEENRPNLTAILEKAKGLEDGAKDLIDQLNGVLAENREPLNNSLIEVEALLKDAGAIVDGLANEIEALVKTLQDTLNNAEGLTGTAKQFLDDNRPEMESMLRDLQETLRYLKSFSLTLSQQPQSVIRGKAPDGRKE